MSTWGWIAGAYGATLALAAAVVPVPRRVLVGSLCVAFALAGLGLATLETSVPVQFAAPGLLLLAGYWLSGLFFRDPQAWLERALVDADARLFHASGIDRWLPTAPGWLLEGLEVSYLAVHLMVVAGALIVAPAGTAALAGYWSLVLACGFSCYVALPWLRSRPPRTIEGARYARPAGPVRRFNVAILDRASVQANTIPSGHVAAAMATALGVLPVNPAAAAALLVGAVLIAIAAVLGRYHYAIDCVSGASVALALSLLF